MNKLPIRVVKVGGSLFSRGDLGPRLQAWLARQPSALHILVAGGGDLTDVVRKWDDAHKIGESRSHWLCIQALGVSAEVLGWLLPKAQTLKCFIGLKDLLAELQGGVNPHRIVFDIQQFLSHHEPRLPPEPVPHSWSVTTDSLAARLAEVIAADELILLKSIPPLHPEATLTDLAGAGYVDDYFPVIGKRLPKITFQVP